MALLAPSPRALRVRETAAAALPHSSATAACSTVGGGAARRALWLWDNGGGTGTGRRKEHRERVRPEAYCWDVSRPVEMEEIDSIEKLDDALRWSVENNQPVVIDWYESASLLVVAHVATPAMISLYSVDLSGFRMLIVIRVESR
jgi:hypothetical protein